jgi:hypothetical protein
VAVIVANYDLGGDTIRHIQMNSRSVKAGHVPDSTNVDNEPVTEIVTERSDPIKLANVDVMPPAGN